MNKKFITYKSVDKKRYIIYDDGKIFDLKLNKFLSPFIRPDGYYAIGLMSTRNGIHKSRSFSLHRLVAYEFIPNPENYPTVNHKDGNKLNPSVDNLEWCTQLYNNLHAIRTGLRPIGEDSVLANITNKEVEQVCSMMENGYKNKEISDELSIPYTTIQNIRNRSSWNHISNKYSFSTKKRIEEKEVRKICEYLELGFKPKEISKMMNIPKPTILNIRNLQTWTDISVEYKFNQPHHIMAETVEKICEDIEAGMTNESIAQKYNISYYKVYRIRKRETWTEISSKYTKNFI